MRGELKIICARQWVMHERLSGLTLCLISVERDLIVIRHDAESRKYGLMIFQKKKIEECIYSYTKIYVLSEVMTADYYNDTKILNFLVEFLTFLIVLIKQVQLQL